MLSSWILLGALVTFSGCGTRQNLEEIAGENDSPRPRTFLRLTDGGERVLSTAFCAPDSQGQFPDGARVLHQGTRTVRTRSGPITTFYSTGGGCIRRPLREVWAASLNWGPMQWNDTGRATVRRVEPNSPGQIFKYRVGYRVDVFPLFSVDWNMDWGHSLIAGTLEHPEELVLQFKKTSGTHYINWWKGRIDLFELEPNLTSFSLDVDLLAHGKNGVATHNQVLELYEKLSRVEPHWPALQR